MMWLISMSSGGKWPVVTISLGTWVTLYSFYVKEDACSVPIAHGPLPHGLVLSPEPASIIIHSDV